MPKIKRAIPESDQLVVRPIAIGIIQEIMIDRLALPADTKINYPGYTETVAQPHGFISNPHEPNRFPTTDKVVLEVTENYIEDLLPSVSTDGRDNVPMWLNDDLEIGMYPIYASMEMRFSIHYRAKNKTDARRFYDMMMLKLPDREDTWLHTINYSYSMPEAYMVILKGIHELVEKQEGYGEDFETFFAKWVNPRYGMLTDQVGKNTLGVFSETQQRCIGYFDDPIAPDWGSRKDETDVWEVVFPYVLRYEKPKDVFFSYPIVIHNSVLSKKYRGTSGQERTKDHLQSRTKSMSHLKQFESMESAYGTPNEPPGRYFPLFDEFIPRNVPQNTIRVFTTLVLLDDEKPNLLMNIKDLEAPSFGLKLSDCIKDYIRKECQYVTTPRQSIVQIGLYMGRNLMDGRFIQVDEDLNITSIMPLSKRQYYHIRVSLLTDFTYLTEAARARLRKYPCVVQNTLDYILPEQAKKPDVKVILGEIIPSNLDDIAEVLKGRTHNAQMKTVQFTRVNAVYEHNR